MVRRSILYSFSEKSAGLILALLTMAIVSRLMTPAEIGLFMVASSMVILVEAFRDFGVASFLIQEPELTPELTRSAVTVIAVMSLVMGGTLALGAGLAGAAYGDPRLGEVIRIGALSFLAAPLGNPLLALMRRDMDFKAVARVGILAALANAGTTILLAAGGVGAASLAWGMVAGAFTGAAVAGLLRPEWRIFRPSLRQWGRILPFGAWTTIVTILGMMFDAAPRLILGRVLDFTAVGLFARAVSLTQLPDRLLLAAVPPVVLPALAAQVRARAPLARPYLHGLSLITAVHWPALLCLAVLADPVVRLLLGDQWLASIPLVRVIALAAMILSPVYLAFPVMVATGRIREMAMVSLAALPLSIAMIAAASPFGPLAVAFSLFPANAIYVGLMLVRIRRIAGFDRAAIGWLALRSGGVACAAALCPLLIVARTGPALSPAATVVAVAGAALGWGAGLFLTHHPLGAEIAHLLPARRRAARLGGSES